MNEVNIIIILKYIGYVVVEKGIHPDPDEVEAILNIYLPKKSMRSVDSLEQHLGTGASFPIPHPI